jgi:hypothetical protein
VYHIKYKNNLLYDDINDIMIHLMILMMIQDGILLLDHQQQLLLNLPRSESSSK